LTVQFGSVQFSLCDVNDALEINVIAHISGCFNVSLVRERENKPYNRNFKHTDTRKLYKIEGDNDNVHQAGLNNNKIEGEYTE